MKKQWISVKCGLSRDPKHRQTMGESVWLFLHILDIASWDDGIAHDWKDEAAAEEMGMPVRTLREHRRKLDELGYITCNQKQYTQDIVIHNWTNPREYSGQSYNKKQGDRIMEPVEAAQGDTQGYIQGNRKDVTPTYNSNNQISVGGYNIFQAYESNIGIITPMIANSLKDAEKEYPKEWTIEAMQLSVENNKRNWRYVEAILKRWKTDGKDEGKGKPKTDETRPEYQPFPFTEQP